MAPDFCCLKHFFFYIFLQYPIQFLLICFKKYFKYVIGSFFRCIRIVKAEI